MPPDIVELNKLSTYFLLTNCSFIVIGLLHKIMPLMV